jgi:hypothetical protein
MDVHCTGNSSTILSVVVAWHLLVCVHKDEEHKRQRENGGRKKGAQEASQDYGKAFQNNLRFVFTAQS